MDQERASPGMGTKIMEHEAVSISHSTVQQPMDNEGTEVLNHSFLPSTRQLGLEPMSLDS